MTQTDTKSASPSPFWTFSLSLYGKPGVPDACLTLQDGAGVDVNLLLFGLYLGRTGRKLSSDETQKIAQTTEPWRAGIVVSLREARRALKEPPAPFNGPLAEALRKSVKSSELEAERIQQEVLFVTFSAKSIGVAEPDLAKACAQNVDAYRIALGTSFNEAAVATLLTQAETISATKG
jgi:uncharacterized protein (TIGR02444 family)